MEAGDCEFAKFTLRAFKGNFEGTWLECVWQQAITCCSCYKMPKTACFSMNLWFYGQPKNNAKTLFSTLHHFSLVIFATATVVALYTQHEPTPTQKLAQKWQLQPFTTSCTKDYKGHSLVQTSFTELPKKKLKVKVYMFAWSLSVSSHHHWKL